MIRRMEHEGLMVIENEQMAVELDLLRGLSLRNLIHKSLPLRSPDEQELFLLEIEGNTYKCSQFIIEGVLTAEDQTEEMVSVTLSEPTANLVTKVIFLHNKQDKTISFILQAAANWDESGPKEVYLHMPFLAPLSLPEKNHYFFPANPISKRDGSSIIQPHVYFPMPLGIFSPNKKQGFCLQFPTLSEHWFIWAQNRNMDLNHISSLEDLKNHKLLLRPDHVLADVMEIKFTAIENGWNEMFHNWREDVRKTLEFDEYERPEISWYKDTFLQHFTYIFSKEVYNFEKNEVDIQQLLQQGEEFGGYDSVLLWHQYPRLGVDKRNQWEFFDDFPGGIDGLKTVVEQLHSHGIKVFLPFKPWDIGYHESSEQSTKCLVDLIKKTDIDGVFLDTMDSVPKSFRTEVNEIKPGFIFCSEGRPKTKGNIQLLTGSWNQYKNKESMPEADLFRYVMPEHFSPIISRWHVGVRKDLAIKRAIFNGTGILIWQDIFGTWLPYNSIQKALIKKWKQIWRQNQHVYQCSGPIPLQPTLKEGLYCNYFPSNDGCSAIYSLYNDTDAKISGQLLKHNLPLLNHVQELWKEAPITIGKNHIIEGSIEAKELLIIKTAKDVSFFKKITNYID